MAGILGAALLIAASFLGLAAVDTGAPQAVCADTSVSRALA